MMRVVYPWSAVVGQEQLKHALLLNAIDPAIGGVLLSGPRGVAKTTLARALGELIAGPFVELPLGASDDRVTGTLDLQRALQGGQLAFSPGLLARAHGGVLYVDEVNLLPDALVDLLLDAASSGQNVVERDGVSHQHPARFVLIGTMNPDEGELRPQLTDRFGLAVHAEADVRPANRSEIVQRRLAFDADPAAFCERFAAEQAALVARVQRARERAQRMAFGERAVARVSELCFAARVEGVRADLAMLRAARAHASWHEREQIAIDDVEAVAELALAHRRGKSTGPDGGGRSGAEGPQEGSRSRPSTEAATGAQPPTNSAAGSPWSGHGAAGPHGREPPEPQGGPSPSDRNRPSHASALCAVPVQAGRLGVIPATWLPPSGRRSEHRRRGRPRVALTSRTAGAREPSQQQSVAIAWFASVLAAVRRGSRRIEQVDLRFHVTRTPNMQHWVVALDCSTSMVRHGSLAKAKAFVLALQREAHRTGAHVSVLAFRGAGATLAAASSATRATRERVLRELAAGGGTPLGRAVREALREVTRRPFGSPDVGKRIFLLTDGRSREAPSELGLLMRRHAPRGLEPMVIDCERGPVRLGRARSIAGALAARCVHIDDAPGA